MSVCCFHENANFVTWAQNTDDCRFSTDPLIAEMRMGWLV